MKIMKNKIAVFFRTPSTDDLISRARALGFINNEDLIVVVCREDELEKPGDIPVWDWECECNDEVKVIMDDTIRTDYTYVLMKVCRASAFYTMIAVGEHHSTVVEAPLYGIEDNGRCMGCGVKCAPTEEDESWDYCECPRPGTVTPNKTPL